MARNPLARAENLVIQDLDDEILVYDETTAHAHCLNGVAAQVWRACDGELSVADMAAHLELEEVVVKDALIELESNGLLDGPVLFNGSTRRQFSISAVKAGAAIGAAPMIYSIVAPVPAAAITVTPATCLSYSSGSCDNCTKICGCCCCCQGCSNFTSSCKACYTVDGCPTLGSQCQGLGAAGKCSSGGKCSAKPRPPCPPGVLPGPTNNCCVAPCSSGASCVGLNGNSSNCGCTGVAGCGCPAGKTCT